MIKSTKNSWLVQYLMYLFYCSYNNFIVTQIKICLNVSFISSVWNTNEMDKCVFCMFCWVFTYLNMISMNFNDAELQIYHTVWTDLACSGSFTWFLWREKYAFKRTSNDRCLIYNLGKKTWKFKWSIKI